MVLRYYRGGPRATAGKCFWLVHRQDRAIRDEHYSFVTFGCDVAARQGADIPDDTYYRADPKISQALSTIDDEIGENDTAILPLEFR